MKIIFDNLKYLTEKKDIKRKYFVPLMLTNAMYGIPILVIAALICITFGVIVNVPFETIRPWLGGLFVSVLIIFIFVLAIIIFFVRDIPANSKYGFFTERYEKLAQEIVNTPEGYVLRVHYKNKKGKPESFDIELRDSGFYKELAEDVVDLTFSQDGRAWWFRSFDKYVNELEKEYECNELRDDLKEKFEVKWYGFSKSVA